MLAAINCARTLMSNIFGHCGIHPRSGYHSRVKGIHVEVTEYYCSFMPNLALNLSDRFMK